MPDFQSLHTPCGSGLASRKGRKAAPGSLPYHKLPGLLRSPFATQGRTHKKQCKTEIIARLR